MEKIRNKGRQVVLASTLLNFMTGVLYTWSLISKDLVENFGWTSKEASIPYTLYSISFVLAMVAFGKVQDTKGPRFLSSIGGILIGLGFILSGIIISPMMLIITIGILVGIGVGIITVSTTPPAIKWFPLEMKGRITGMVVAGVGLSSVFYSPVVNYALSNVGLTRTFIYIGLLILSSTLFLSYFLVNPPVNFNPNCEVVVGKNMVSTKDYDWNEMIKTGEFWKIWFMLGFNSTAGLMIISHISNISKVQVNWEGGFILVILVSIFNTLGRFFGGSLSDKLGRINLMRMIFILQGINMVLFSYYNNISVMIIGVAIAGLCYGSSFSVFPAMIGDYYGPKNFGINYGLMFTGWALGGILGPMVAAAIFDATNKYHLAYIIALLLLIFSIFLTFTFNEARSKS